MRAVVQRVKSASVRVGEEMIAQIGKGLLVLVGIGKEDSPSDAKYLAEKVIKLRLFEDEQERMNLSLPEVSGEVLAVSQFTLYGDCRKGNRPSFTEAADPKVADSLYQEFVNNLRASSLKVETGEFQAKMLVNIENDGPVTLILDSK